MIILKIRLLSTLFSTVITELSIYIHVVLTDPTLIENPVLVAILRTEVGQSPTSELSPNFAYPGIEIA